MSYCHKVAAAVLAVCLLSACGPSPVPLTPSTSALLPTPAATPVPTPMAPLNPSTPVQETGGQLSNPYIAKLADDTLAGLELEGRDDFGRIAAVYEHLIATTYFAPPLGLDSWQLYDGGTPNYTENRALSPLAYGVGSCEDYACAMVVLLERMGFQARYVPGITISVQGDFVDHAWAAVRVGESWYHLDPQLEDNIMKDGLLRYRYFLKTDREMLPDHRWGGNLLEYAQLTPKQRQEVEQNYLLPLCNREYSSPAPRTLDCLPRPNISALTTEISARRADYETTNGKLPRVTLDIVPPVFGNEGYGPPD